ncbi:hypothetical protein BBJ28_00004673 [Nothophytophthora sp. Chile5]|nr:hypothetical protein BBJ28_00004673 [Nothophytophthora sp. Chile5]
MLFVLLTSIVWTVWLIVLTIDPNGAANCLTNTAEFDSGEFWLIIDPEPVFMAVSVFSLVVLALAYFLVVLQMTLLRNSVDSIKPSEKTTTSMCSTFKPRFKFTQKVVELWHELTAFNGRKRNFDMLFAVGWPILWLAYSITHFQFDRAKALLILQTYPPAWFERRARLAADASEVTLFQISFDALRMKSGSDLCLRMAMNLSFCYRLKRVAEYLIRQRRRALHPTQSRDPSQFKISRSVAAFFVAVSAFILMYVHQSIALSSAACEAFPQCVAFAYRWQEHGPCACRALIDGDRAPRTYAEWIHPVDVTDVVSQLATSGDLRVLQLINRQLPVWPEQLQRCTDLRTM